RQRRQIHVAAGQDHPDPLPRQALALLQYRRQGDRRGRFHQQLEPGPQQPQRGEGVGILHDRHLGAVRPKQLEARLAQRAAQAVADRVGDEVHVAPARGQRARGIGGAGRLGEQQPGLRCQRAQRQGAAAGEAATAHRRHQHVEPAARAQQLQRGGALAGDHRRIGVGMDEGRAGLVLHPRRGFLARGDARRAAVQDRAVALDGRQFRRDRAFGHDHVAGDAAGPRRQRQRRAVVARGVRDHAARGLRVGQRPHRVARAAELEGTGALQRFGLEMQFAAGQRVQGARAQHRGHAGVRRDPRGRRQHVRVARQGHRGTIHRDIVVRGRGPCGADAAIGACVNGSGPMPRVRAKLRRNSMRGDDAGRQSNGGRPMIRKLILPALAALVLAGCATGYQYRGGSGDYYYGSPGVEYRYYGYGYYGYPYGSYGYYGYPYYYGGYYGRHYSPLYRRPHLPGGPRP